MPASTAVAPLPELRDVHESIKIGPYLSELWARRSYIWFISLSQLRARQITTVLGNFWHLLNPALSIGVYYIIFGLLLDTRDGVDNYILFLTVGMFTFQYTQKSTIDGARSVVTNLGLLKAIKFPRAMLPVTSTVTETIASLSTYVVLYGVAVVTGQEFRWQWVLLPLVAIGQFFFNLGAALVAARATTHFRDAIQILPFVFRLLLYGSGVIFSVDAYTEGNWFSVLFTLNPIYCFITIARWCILGGSLDGALLVSAAAWTAATFVLGFLWFRAAEERYARD